MGSDVADFPGPHKRTSYQVGFDDGLAGKDRSLPKDAAYSHALALEYERGYADGRDYMANVRRELAGMPDPRAAQREYAQQPIEVELPEKGGLVIDPKVEDSIRDRARRNKGCGE